MRVERNRNSKRRRSRSALIGACVLASVAIGTRLPLVGAEGAGAEEAPVTTVVIDLGTDDG